MTRLQHYAAEHQRDRDKYRQPGMYTYNREVHRCTNSLLFSLTLSRLLSGSLTLDYPTALPTVETETTSLHAVEAALILSVAYMRMRSLQRRNKDHHDRKFCNALMSLSAGQYIYVDRPPMALSAAVRLATDFYNKFMPREPGTFEVIEVSPTTIAINEDWTLDTVSVDEAKL